MRLDVSFDEWEEGQRYGVDSHAPIIGFGAFPEFIQEMTNRMMTLNNEAMDAGRRVAGPGGNLASCTEILDYGSGVSTPEG